MLYKKIDLHCTIFSQRKRRSGEGVHGLSFGKEKAIGLPKAHSTELRIKLQSA